MTRALRIGVLLGGTLVEEKLFPLPTAGRATPITFGQSLRCAISLPTDGVPHEHALFVADQGRLLLRTTAAMHGRFAHGETTTELAAGTAAEHALSRGVRGKLVLGDATLLFQELAAAPASPRAVLPASLRGSLADRIDRRLAVIIGASVLVHLGIAGYAWLTDVPTTSMLETPIAATYHHDSYEISLPDEPTPTAPPMPTEPTAGAATPVAPAQTPTPIVPPTRVRPSTGPVPAMSTEEAQRFASILTGTETGTTGLGPMRDRTPGADLGTQIDDVGKRPVTIGTTNDNGFRQQQDPHLGTHNGPDIHAPEQVTSNDPKHETNPSGRIQVKPIPGEAPDSTLTVKMVLDKINTVYMQGLQRCYKRGLVEDSTLSGKIAMAFTVSERGTLDEREANGVSSGVDACVRDFMATWRFPTPKGKDGDPTEQAFQLALQLTPN